MTFTPEQAIANAKAQSANGPQFGEGECLMRVQEMYGIVGAPGEVNAPDAITAWNRATKKRVASDPTSIPRGAPIFWSGGSAGHGHVTISAGMGKCWSTDIKRVGYFDLTYVDSIRTSWGLTLLGWTEDLEGVTVFTPPAPKPTPATKETPVAVQSPGAVFIATVEAACRQALLTIPARRQVQRAAVVAVRTIARTMKP